MFGLVAVESCAHLIVGWRGDGAALAWQWWIGGRWVFRPKCESTKTRFHTHSRSVPVPKAESMSVATARNAQSRFHLDRKTGFPVISQDLVRNPAERLLRPLSMWDLFLSPCDLD